MADTLILYHALSISKHADDVIASPMKCLLFVACDDDIRNAFESLDHRDLSQVGYDQFERSVCQVYTSKVYTANADAIGVGIAIFHAQTCVAV